MQNAAINGFRGRERTALISLPWNLADRPNLPLGVLKSYLSAQGISVDAYHLHLTAAQMLGRERYDRIAMDWRFGEALYSALYTPTEAHRILAAFEAPDGGISSLLCDVERITIACLAEIDLSRYHLLGFSVAHLQLMSSLYVARQIKTLNPDITIVFGGRGVVGPLGRNLLAACGEIDMVVNGEGESALLHLCRLLPPLAPEKLADVPNLIYRTADDGLSETPQRRILDLAQLPAPDYEDFYASATALGYPASESVLPIEASRGCSWEHRGGRSGPAACAFCGLNAGWPDYREKPLTNVIEEIHRGIERYQALDLSFVDSCLPESYRNPLLEHLIAMDDDLTIFCELRPDFSEKTARLLAQAGTRKVQIGIEGFSTALLQRLGKGVQAIDNLYRLKLCTEYHIPFQYNLLTHIPGSTREELDETMITITRLFGFQPPHAVPFFLSRGSRAHRCPQAFGIDPQSLDHRECDYLPAFLAGRGVTEDVSFDCSTSDPFTEAWDQVVRLVDIWGDVYRTARQRFATEHPLSFRRAGRFITITDLREMEKKYITLEGMDMKIFLACRGIRDLRGLETEFHPIDRAQVTAAVNRLETQGVVMREGRRVLALPVRAPLPGGVSSQVRRC